jgi:hypothetical protein
MSLFYPSSLSLTNKKKKGFGFFLPKAKEGRSDSKRFEGFADRSFDIQN